MEKFTSAQILEQGAGYFDMGRKAALKSLVWFGFGYHGAMIEGDKQARDYLADMKSLLEKRGAVRSEQFAKAKVAKLVGTKFEALFGAELATDWASDKDMIQACFNAAQASGATTVKRLQDWAEHGDPDYTDAKKTRDKEARDKAKADEIAKRLDAVDSVAVDMDFDAVPAPVQNLDKPEPVTETKGWQSQADAVADAENFVASLTDTELAALVSAAAAELAKRDAAAVAEVA